MYKIHIITKRLLIYAVYWTLVFQLSGAWDIQKDTLSKQFPRVFFAIDIYDIACENVFIWLLLNATDVMSTFVSVNGLVSIAWTSDSIL